MSKSGKKPKRPAPMRLAGPNGEFVSSFPKNGNTVTVGHLEELCEWIYHHNNMTNAEKLERITQVEGMIGMYFSGEDENGNLKTKLILLPGSLDNGESETKKALQIMKAEKLL